MNRRAKRHSIWLEGRRHRRAEHIGAQGEQSFVSVIASRLDEGAIRSSKGVIGWEDEKWAWHGRGSRAVGDGEPAERADNIASGGGVDDAALESPIRSGAIGLNGSSEIGGGGGWVGAGDNNDEHAKRVGATEQLEGGKGTAQPRQRSSSRVGEIGSGAGEVDAVNRRQDELGGVGRSSRRRKAGGKSGLLVHGTAKGDGGVQARSELGAELGGTRNESRNRCRKEQANEGESGSSWDHDNRKDAGQRVQVRQGEGKGRKARVDR
jgi:hypothetical protein